MIAFVKWLIRYVKKDYRFLERYEKEHRHFFWFIGLDALVSALIAIVAFQILGPTSATNAFGKWLENSGPVGLTVDKFIDKVHNEHELAYWIGPMQGMQYTIDQTLDDMDVVTYLPKSSFDVIAAKPHLTIETFADDQTFARHLHVLSNVPMAKVLIQGGISVEYDASAVTSAVVRISGKPETIVLDYSNSQNPKSMISDASKLRRVH